MFAQACKPKTLEFSWVKEVFFSKREPDIFSVKIFIVLFCNLFFQLLCFSQNNNDCINFVYVCGDTLFPISSNGHGNIIEIPDPDNVGGSTTSNPTKNTDSVSTNLGCLLTGETFSTWLMFPIKETGILEFYFATANSSYPQSGYYDWTLFNLTGKSCDDIINNTIAPVRCNWNGKDKGGTGMTDFINLPAGADSANFERPLSVISGENYVICFNNYSSISGIVPMEFKGTAKLGLSLPPKVKIEGDSVICRGDTAALKVSNFLQGASFLWSTGETSQTIEVNPEVSETYIVKSYLYNCENIESFDTIIVIVDQYLSSSFDVSDSAICEYGIFEINHTGNSSPTAQYVWSFIGAVVDSMVSNDYYKLFYDQSGTHSISLYLKDGNCISGQTSKEIKVSTNPKAEFSTVPDEATINNPVINFRNESSGANADVIWDFDDNTSSFLDNPYHTFKTSGDFKVTLKVFNIMGCYDTISKYIKIRPELTFFIPNAFTPNEDGFNDTFYGTGDGIASYEMYIFNLWGKEIFKSTNPEIYWNGKLNGKWVSNGTYVYFFKINDYNGTEYRFMDYLLLIR